MNRACTFLACIAVSGLAIADSPPTDAEFRQLASRSLCEQPGPGRFVYAGDSGMLNICLDMGHRGVIHELRITSRGGLPDDTLKVVQKYLGNLDHLIVDGLCAGSCAAYILPAAKRVSVSEHSYVLLQRATSVRVIDEERTRIMAELRKHMPDASEDEVNRAFEWSRQKALAEAAAQEAFAKQALACVDWLDPTAPPDRALPETSTFLLVTPEMAKRCLKKTRLESFWPPEAQDKFAPKLRIFRARR